MSSGYNGLPAYYVESSDPVTPNVGFSLKGMDPIIAENFVLADNAIGSGGSKVKVNGSAVSNPNFNGTTPSAPAGNTNVTWQSDVSGNVSAYITTPGNVSTAGLVIDNFSNLIFTSRASCGAGVTSPSDSIKDSPIGISDQTLAGGGVVVAVGGLGSPFDTLSYTQMSVRYGDDCAAQQASLTIDRDLTPDSSTGSSGEGLGITVITTLRSGTTDAISETVAFEANFDTAFAGVVNEYDGFRVHECFADGGGTLGTHIAFLGTTSASAFSLNKGLYISSNYGYALDLNPSVACAMGISPICHSTQVGRTTAPTLLDGWYTGTGSPAGSVSANIGSMYSNTTGGIGTSFWVKESGSGNTGWASVLTSDSTLQPIWNNLQNATGALVLANAGNATTFDQTSPVNWTWANTTLATSGAAQASPIINISGQYWTGAASAADTWTIQDVLANGTNGKSTLTFGHSGTTGTQNVVFGTAAPSGSTITFGTGNAVATIGTGAVFSAANSSFVCIGNIAAAASQLFFACGSSSSIFLSTDGGASAGIAFSGNIVSKYKGVSTVSSGIPSEIATVDLTAQAAAINATTLYAVPASAGGLYRVSVYAKVTQAATSSSTLGGSTGLVLTFTDNTDSVAQTVTAQLGTQAGTSAINNAGNATTSVLQGEVLIWAKGSTNIQYAFGYTSSGVTVMQYELHLKAEAM